MASSSFSSPPSKKWRKPGYCTFERTSASIKSGPLTRHASLSPEESPRFSLHTTGIPSGQITSIRSSTFP